MKINVTCYTIKLDLIFDIDLPLKNGARAPERVGKMKNIR